MIDRNSKHLARTIILQKLFERYFRSEDISKVQSNEFSNEELFKISEQDEKYDRKLASELLEGIIKNVHKADYIIQELAPEWPINQINKADLQILRLAIYEGFIGKQTAEKIVIDEAVELAKEFGGKPSANFVNGVLGNLLINKEKYKKALTLQK